jgi:WD40 repeat protein
VRKIKEALALAFWLASTTAFYGQTVKPLAKLEAPGELRFAVVCNGGQRVVGVAGDHDLYEWSLPSGARRAISVADGRISLAACGEALAIGYKDGTVSVLDVAGNERRRIKMEYEPGAIALSADGELLAAATFYSPVQVWDVSSGKLLWSGSTDFGNTGAIGIAPDRNLIVTADGDTHVRAYDGKGKMIYSTDTGLLEPFDVNFSADAKKFAVAGAEGTIELHDSATGKMLKKSANSGNPIFGVMAAPEGTKVLALELDVHSLEQAGIGYWDTNDPAVKNLAIEAKTVLALGKSETGLLLVRQEGHGQISVDTVN